MNPSLSLDNLREDDWIQLCVDFCRSVNCKDMDFNNACDMNKRIIIIFNNIDKSMDYDAIASKTLAIIRFIYSMTWSDFHSVVIDKIRNI